MPANRGGQERKRPLGCEQQLCQRVGLTSSGFLDKIPGEVFFVCFQSLLFVLIHFLSQLSERVTCVEMN